jgi:hypothetical protein
MMEQEIAGTMIKGGEDVTRISIHRSPLAGKVGVGFLVTIQVHPRIEEFVRSLGTGEYQDVRVSGRYWRLVGSSPLYTYNMHNPLGQHSMGTNFFCLDRPGQVLLDTGEEFDGPSQEERKQGRGETINLSPLRLVGASEGAGVTFGVKGVYRIDMLKHIRDMFMEASRQFYITYLKPVNLSVIVSTQEIYPPSYQNNEMR